MDFGLKSFISLDLPLLCHEETAAATPSLFIIYGNEGSLCFVSHSKKVNSTQKIKIMSNFKLRPVLVTFVSNFFACFLLLRLLWRRFVFGNWEGVLLML